MADDALTNPAKRLHKILSTAFGYQGQVTREVWRAVLCENSGDDTELLWALLALQALAGEAEELLGSVPPPHQVADYVECFPEIRQAISSDKLQAEWNSVRGHLSDATLMPLRYGGLTLEATLHESVIDESVLVELRKQVAQVREAICASGLEAGFKRQLLRQLDEIDRALRLYRITGARGLRAALSNTLGVMAMRRDRFKAWWNNSTLKPFVEILAALDLVLSKVDGLPLLKWGGAAVKALTASGVLGG